jgi:hypothetical protein
VIIPLVESGQLPGFKRFIERGSYGVLRSYRSVQPSTKVVNAFTPAVWTTIATGKTPQEHNILDFTIGYDKAFYKAVLNLTGVIKLPGRLTLSLMPNRTVLNQAIRVQCNGRPVAQFNIRPLWQDYSIELDQVNDTRIELELFYADRCPAGADTRSRDTAFALRKIQFIPEPKSSMPAIDLTRQNLEQEFLVKGGMTGRERPRLSGRASISTNRRPWNICGPNRSGESWRATARPCPWPAGG